MRESELTRNMQITAIMPLRNAEIDCGMTIRAALLWCDNIVIGLHACTDRSAEICGQIWTEHLGRMRIIDLGDDPQWDEMEHRQRLLNESRDFGATHIAIVDSDEMLTANALPHIRASAFLLQPMQCLEVPGFAIWGALDKYRIDGPFKRQMYSLVFRDHPELYWKARGTDQYQHHHRKPMGATGINCALPCFGGVMHLQYLRQRMFRAKQAHYQAQELLRWPQFGAAAIRKKYSWWNTAEEQIDVRTAPFDWLSGYESLLDHANLLDGCGWHERELKVMIDKYGKDTFKDLDFFGVA